MTCRRDQDQFLAVVDRDTADRRWREAIGPVQPATEMIRLSGALGRVLAEDIRAEVDVPAFDRSNFDGYAVRAEDTFGATEQSPRWLKLNEEALATGVAPRITVEPGTATTIATGGMIPRGADAVVMIEHTHLRDDVVIVHKPVPPGAGIAFAGTDMGRGELVLRRGTLLTARETGVLAAIGRDSLTVIRSPGVAILSTGDELVPPGVPLRPGQIHDANATLLADAVRELGGIPQPLGIIPDDADALERALEHACSVADVVLLSGGTSKGAGDLSYRVLHRRRPGIVVHGVALKPGKPVCLGLSGTTPVAILPGFPTSAIFTFHEFVAPLVRRLAGRDETSRPGIPARVPTRINSERGRTEYVLVNLVPGASGLAAYPMGKGSGSVTAFSRADGFVVIPKHQEYLEAGETVAVVPLGHGLEPADLVAIGSHCIGLDRLLGFLQEAGFRSKTIWVGSQGGLAAAERGECDVAGVHLLDPASGEYNRPFLPPGARLLPGYGRMQGIVFRPGDVRFEGKTVAAAVAAALADRSCVLVNRNRGSGTRVLIDELLGCQRPPGYAVEARSHNAVVAAVVQGRADWGLAIAPVAEQAGLGFLPLAAERYDFVIPETRWERPPVVAFRSLLERPDVLQALAELGFSR